MKKLYFLMPLMACLMAFLACDDSDKYVAYPPTWKGFTLDPDKSSIYAGDTVNVTACQDEKGHLINATTYTWTLSLDTVASDNSTAKYEISASAHTNYDGTSNADPTHKFVIPSNAVSNTRATITFAASYAYSCDGIEVSNNETYDATTNYNGSIYSQSATLFGKANGSVSFYVKTR